MKSPALDLRAGNVHLPHPHPLGKVTVVEARTPLDFHRTALA